MEAMDYDGRYGDDDDEEEEEEEEEVSQDPPLVFPDRRPEGNFLDAKAALYFGSGKFRFILPIY